MHHYAYPKVIEVREVRPSEPASQPPGATPAGARSQRELVQQSLLLSPDRAGRRKR